VLSLCSKGPVWKSLYISGPRMSWNLFFSVSTAILTFAFHCEIWLAFHSPRTKVGKESDLVECHRVLLCFLVCQILLYCSAFFYKGQDIGLLALEDDSTAVIGIFQPLSHWLVSHPRRHTVITPSLAKVLCISGLHSFSTSTRHVGVSDLLWECASIVFILRVASHMIQKWSTVGIYRWWMLMERSHT
jgi:hypothetical protein